MLSKSDSVCPGCSRGCNIEIDYADDKIFRLLPRFNPEVNSYWMCDEGRYGYKFVNEGRILRPLVREGGKQVESSHPAAMRRLAEMMRRYPLDEIGVVGHAWETVETLAALVAFAREVLKSIHLYGSLHQPPNPSSDGFLITADKNPNQAALAKLGFKPFSQAQSVKALLVANNLSRADLALVSSKNIPILALWATNESEAAKIASVVLPIPTFAEQEGHFINVQGIEQKISRAFEPRGELIPLVQSLKALREAL